MPRARFCSTGRACGGERASRGFFPQRSRGLRAVHGVSTMNKPFFRADQVGSLLRPPELLAARERYHAGTLDAAGLRAIEDRAIRDVVALQESIGLAAVTDGEFRRENWWIDFISRMPGVEIREGRDNDAFTNAGDVPWSYVPKDVVTTQRIRHRSPVSVEDFVIVRDATRGTAKITLPSPTRMHFHGGRRNVSREAYPAMEVFFADVAAYYRAEIAALEAAGCRYVQIDDPLLTYFLSDRLRASLERQGDQPDALLRTYVELFNACVRDVRPDTRVGVHLCRGNSRSSWISEGTYDRIADQVYPNLHADSFLLEYDDERSGGFEPLARIPRQRQVVLGLVTTKHGRLEREDDLKRRIDAASRHVPVENLAISPQCGFASVVEGNVITPDDQRRKLELVVRVATAVWGAAAH
jgi:5-methyltetrahydropteroyltriglutamate--homocysteine methyltransferase